MFGNHTLNAGLGSGRGPCRPAAADLSARSLSAIGEHGLRSDRQPGRQEQQRLQHRRRRPLGLPRLYSQPSSLAPSGWPGGECSGQIPGANLL